MSSSGKRVLLAIVFGILALLPLLNSTANAQPTTSVHINEVESSGGVPGDWVELINVGSTPVDLSGWRFLDNDDTHVAYLLPAGSTIPAGGYFLLEEANFGFGLGAADSARLYDPSGSLYESYVWTSHAATTYGRCPNGTGSFVTTTSVTKGGANDCSSPIRINEVESNNGIPGDWVELFNTSTSAVDISGFVVRDSDDAHAYTLPGGTSLGGGGYYVLEESALGFTLDAADNIRLFSAAGVSIDTFSWAAHATTTFGRCPNGSGQLATTRGPTKGATNDCLGVPVFAAWPGGTSVETVDGLNVFNGNMSGLFYEASQNGLPGVIWAVRNSPSTLFRLVFNGSIYTPDPNNNWGAGKTLFYPTGSGGPDTEGLTFAEGGPAGGIYVATERDNNVSSVSRPTILRFDPTTAGTTLTATREWNLTADLPAVGANLGLEGITFVPDAYLVHELFFDESKGHLYNPGEYPNHGTGLFFVGVEANGTIYAYALDHVGGGFTRIATIASGFPGVMDLLFDRELNNLWAVCDNTCDGRSAVLRIDLTTGRFAIANQFERPSGMPNLNNEGFAFVSLSECNAGLRFAFWADDSETSGHAIRRGTLTCNVLAENNAQLTRSGLVRDRRTGTFAQQFTITNNTNGTLVAPFYLVLDNISPNAALVSPEGTTANYAPLDSPYVQFQVGSLAPGASASVVVQFLNPSNAAISYTGRVLNGVTKP